MPRAFNPLLLEEAEERNLFLSVILEPLQALRAATFLDDRVRDARDNFFRLVLFKERKREGERFALYYAPVHTYARVHGPCIRCIYRHTYTQAYTRA